MYHGISEVEWTEYVEGNANTALADRIESHMFGCLSCWELHDQMVTATQSLRQAGEDARCLHMRSDRQIRESYHSVLSRIREAEAQELRKGRAQVQQRLEALIALMAPMCGVRTAQNALRAAAAGAKARSLTEITAENWKPFLTALTSIATVMCGETGGRLVQDRGQI